MSFSDAEVDVTDVLVSDLIIPKLDKYYRYKGSLTTPPCYESVTWTMFEQTIPISESQVYRISREQIEQSYQI